jgi:hypothetical protein
VRTCAKERYRDESPMPLPENQVTVPDVFLVINATTIRSVSTTSCCV